MSSFAVRSKRVLGENVSMCDGVEDMSHQGGKGAGLHGGLIAWRAQVQRAKCGWRQ